MTTKRFRALDEQTRDDLYQDVATEDIQPLWLQKEPSPHQPSRQARMVV